MANRIFTGTFKTYDNQNTYSITIGNSGTETAIIDPTENAYVAGSNQTYVMFATDPITITCDRQDLAKRILISQATINLVSNDDLTDYLFADTNRSIPVNIQLFTAPSTYEHAFYGYVDPLQFSQGYAYNFETVSITATDPLGALQDKTVKNVNEAVINSSAELSPWTIITTILNDIGITTIVKSIDATVDATMSSTKIHCKIFFGESQDDWQTYYDVLDTICKYFNLYIAMNGRDSVIVTSTINNTVTAVTISNFKDKATDDSTSISMDDVYSQVSLTCNIEPLPDTIVSFDNNDMLRSDYNDYAKYMTEYVSTGEGDSAWKAFSDILHGRATAYDAAFTIDHYLYVLRNNAWDFGSNSYIDYLGGSIDYSTGITTPMTGDQRKLLKWLYDAPFRAAFVGFSEGNKVMANGVTQDNSVERMPTLDKCLIISTLGTYDNSQTAISRYDTLLQGLIGNDPFNPANPICKFKGIDSNVLSPANSSIVNYILVNGAITLNPLQCLTGPSISTNTDKLTNTWNITQPLADYRAIGGLYTAGLRGKSYTVPYPGIDDGAYYNHFWWYDNANNREAIFPTSGETGVYGFLNISLNKMLQYNYSSAGQTDNISKMPVLCCQMVVTLSDGTKKYCVERLDGGTAIHTWTGATGQNTFEWLTAAECTQNNLSPIFTIGIDPKVEDYIIGQKFTIPNTLDWHYNLDKTGMAIPVHAEDNLSGTVEFSIIGPYNAIWNNYNIYPLSWIIGRTMTYVTDSYCILSNTQSIMVSDLKIEMTSNNGGISREKSNPDKDLVYFSVSDATYIEKLEDDIDICSCITPEEHEELEIKIEDSNSYVRNTNNSAFYGWASGDSEEPWVRPEACYVNYLYKEYATPARILETQLKVETFNEGLYGNEMNYVMLDNYFMGIPAMPKKYLLNGNWVDHTRLMSYTTSLKYKTIDCKFREHRTVDNEQIPTQSV